MKDIKNSVLQNLKSCDKNKQSLLNCLNNLDSVINDRGL
jgi:hypothetical protein